MRHCVLQYFLTLSFFCIFAITASAQATAEAAFKQGQSYQQTMTIAAPDKAIERFVKAKKMYDAAKDKKKCDNAIQVSVNIKKKFKYEKVGDGFVQNKTLYDTWIEQYTIK